MAAGPAAGLTRRGWLAGLLALLASPAAAAPRQARRRHARPPQAKPKPPAPAGPRAAARPQAPASRHSSRQPSSVAPPIDGPPPPSRIPGLEPAPVPRSNPPQAPLADRLPRPELELGIPAPPMLFQGETFSRNDPAPDRRPPPGVWYPSPGVTIRLPF